MLFCRHHLDTQPLSDNNLLWISEHITEHITVSDIVFAACKTHTKAWFDMWHCRKSAFINVAYVDPNMESIFEFNNLRFSPEMFCHISVIKDDCCIVAYGCFFLLEHLQVSGRSNRKSMPKVCDNSSLNAFLRWHFPHFVFSLNKFVYSDAQFYRTTGCWWLFELNSAKVHACKCPLNA